MHTVLDLDLDFFTFPVYSWINWGTSRAPTCEHTRCASVSSVRYFLEQQCGLSKNQPIVGRELVNHDEAFFVWKRWLHQGLLEKKFEVVHVDAHADMGLGGRGHYYLLSELLSLPVERRDDPFRSKNDGLNLGNFLMYAVANHWLSKLTYVYPVQSPWTSNWQDGEAIQIPAGAVPGDLFPIHFRNGDTHSGIIELKHCTKETLDRCAGKRILHPVIDCDDQVQFEPIAARNFKFTGFTHMVVAQSPQYTHDEADELLPLIREYFKQS